MKQTPHICIVIVNYNSRDLVTACIENIVSLNRNDLVFVIVDNSERPDCESISTRYANAVVLRSGKNLGFGGGCNLGIFYAVEKNIPYILLLNPDIRAETDFIGPMLSALASNRDYGIIGPVIVEDNESEKIWQAGGGINWYLGGPVQRCKKLTAKNTLIDVPYLSGCAMLIRTSIIEEVGPMDEHYFLYFEDTDFSLSVARKGYKIGIATAVSIYHQESSIIGQYSELKVYHISRNRLLLLKRWAKSHQLIFYLFFNLFFKSPAAVFLFGLWWRKPTLIKAYFKGFYDGLRYMHKFKKSR